MEKNWLAVVVQNENGQKLYLQFDSEDELDYFLDCNPGCKVISTQWHND